MLGAGIRPPLTLVVIRRACPPLADTDLATTLPTAQSLTFRGRVVFAQMACAGKLDNIRAPVWNNTPTSE